MSYIERDEAVKAIVEHPSNIAPFTRKAIEAIKNLPTADVVEVVRCKDCKHFTIDEGDCLGNCNCQRIARNYGGEIYPEENHFCSYGERKTE